MELFHYAEKELLMARGILKNSISRKAAYIPDSSSVSYIRELNERIVKLVDEIKDPVAETMMHVSLLPDEG
jgi:4-hydroxy-tetrahydrodipicolinate synthase